MKINSNMASFYNASSRVNTSDYNRRVLATEEISKKSPSVNIGSAQTEEKKNEYPSSGVQQTRVSSDNNYQKRMITDPRFAVERMAGKLMEKIPDILNDMKNLPENTTENSASVQKAAAKVVIRENSSVDFNAAQMPLQDISL